MVASREEVRDASQRPEEMIRVLSEAFNSGDVDALVQRSGQTVTGHDAIRQTAETSPA